MLERRERIRIKTSRNGCQEALTSLRRYRPRKRNKRRSIKPINVTGFPVKQQAEADGFPRETLAAPRPIMPVCGTETDMRNSSIGLLVLICAIAVPVLTTGSERAPMPDEVEMIVWEHQNWESNGGFERLTIWSDGRSEVVVAPLRYSHDRQENLRTKSGWERVWYKSPPHVEFVRRNIYPPEVARAKFKGALAAGIHLLESFKPDYLDGGGTRVVVRAKGREREIIVPMFTDREKTTLNYKRFLAVSEVLDGFDRSAYEVVPR